MTANQNDSDARLGSDKARRPGASRTVEASRALIESPSIDINTKLDVIQQVMSLDREAAVSMMPRIMADFTRLVNSITSNANSSDIQVDYLFNLVDTLTKIDPDAAMDIYSQLISSEINQKHRLRAFNCLKSLESKT